MSQVQLILREDVSKLGAAGELVSVKPGYARNYLLPRGLATVATSSRIKELEHNRRVIEDKLARQLKDVNALRHRLLATPLSFEAQAGEEGKLFGSITSQNIADQLAEKGYAVDRRKISLDEPLKTLGEHEIDIKLHHEVTATIKVTITAAE